MNEIDRIKSLITGLQRTQPRIYEAFSAITKALDKLDINLDSIKTELESVPIAGLPIAPNVLVFYYELTRRNVILRWNQPDSSIFHYIVKKGGTDWDNASHLITTATLSAVFDPLPVGTTRYWIKGMDFDGNVSENALPLDVNIPPIASFGVNAVVIDNNVLLTWTIPVSTWDIQYYTLYRETTLIGRQDGTFAVSFEMISGTYTYRVIPTDIAGNIGAEATTTVVVRQPPDFDLVAQGIDDLSGVIDRGLRIGDKILYNVDLVKQWDEHFESHSWETIQDQISAGYPLYIQPALIQGSYGRIMDFGGVFNNVIVNVSWSQNPIAGTMTATAQIRTSADGITWGEWVFGRSVFAESFRYIHIYIEFNGADDTALIEFANLIVSLNVKSEIDSGQIYADKDDIGGTVVLFNKAFKDVNSITVTADSIEPIYPIYDFVDVPNPTSFKVLVYDSSAKRVDHLISWKARGIT
jgi:hypothetical protein